MPYFDERMTTVKFEAMVSTRDLIGLKVISQVAIQHRSLELLKILIQSPAFNVNAEVDDFGNSLLHLACYQGSILKVQMLLSVERINVNSINLRGQTPLHLATRDCSEYHSADIMKLLQQAGADSRLQDDKGHTALHRACISGNKQSIETLLLHATGQKSIYITDKKGLLPLDLASSKVMNLVTPLHLNRLTVSLSPAGQRGGDAVPRAVQQETEPSHVGACGGARLRAIRLYVSERIVLSICR